MKGKDKEVRIEDADSVSGESSIAVMMIVSDIKLMERGMKIGGEKGRGGRI